MNKTTFVFACCVCACHGHVARTPIEEQELATLLLAMSPRASNSRVGGGTRTQSPVLQTGQYNGWNGPFAYDEASGRLMKGNKKKYNGGTTKWAPSQSAGYRSPWFPPFFSPGENIPLTDKEPVDIQKPIYETYHGGPADWRPKKVEVWEKEGQTNVPFSIFRGVFTRSPDATVNFPFFWMFQGMNLHGWPLPFWNSLKRSYKMPEPNFQPAMQATASAPAPAAKPAAGGKQDFLEFEPYYDKKTMPDNTYKVKSPFEAKVVSVKRIVGPKATGETCDVVIDHGGDMPYIEGQSYGVIPPGLNPKNGKPNKVRLYSIASSRYGDDMTGKTTTLCVRRATYWCPELKADDPAKKGVCSNFLCDAKAGDVVKLTGPSGKVMLLPEDKPETDIIMVATGTGIAPMRSFVKRMFVENTPYANDFKGLAWLFLGVANTDALLYDDDWKAIEKANPDQFRYSVALSREQTNKDGGKMYIQDRVEEYSDEIFDRLNKGAHIYFCGLKGMMPGIQDMLKKVATAKGLDYDAFIKKLKKNGQWHVEVY